MPSTSRPPPSSISRLNHRNHHQDENRRRRTHQRIDSSGDILPPESSAAAPRTRRGSSARPSQRRRSAYESFSENEEIDVDRYDGGGVSGSPSKERPKPRDRERRERYRERDGDRERERDRYRERDRERVRDRNRDRERDRDAYASTPRRQRPRDRSAAAPGSSRRQSTSRSGAATSSGMLSSAALAQLDRMNQEHDFDEARIYDQEPRRASGRYDGAREREVRGERGLLEEDRERERERDRDREKERERRKRHEEHRERKKKREMEEKKAAALAAAQYGDGYDSPPQTADLASTWKKERRVASGQALERGASEKDLLRNDARTRGGGGRSWVSSYFASEEADGQRKWWKRKCFIITVVVVVVLILIVVLAAVLTSNNGGGSGSSMDGGGSSSPNNTNLKGISPDSIPKWAQGGYLDPFNWYSTLDFNVTFTDQKVGGLYIMGLNSTWDDNTQANPSVPKLNEQWQYGTLPMRGMNLGGWLSIEPFISPSLFDGFDTSSNVVDEWTLSQTLGATTAATTLEQHYATWVTEQDFADIAAAGFDHVRIPFSYWAVTTYDGDPYVPLISWRYLLRGIEWARKHGLRVNLDLHGLPGSQNGMNHSGHQGSIGWLNGTDGTMNGDRSIEIHDQLSQFFAQPRYKNIIALYGLANEPRMTFLDPTTVINWSQRAITTLRNNNFENLIVVGDGFWALNSWKGELQGDDKVVLDAHQYVIFNTGQIVFNHTEKVNYACGGWTSQAKESMNTNTGFGPTIFGEWSQADTDCATYLNNVGVGSRWEGTLNLLDAPGDREAGASIGSVLSPTCPTSNSPRCDCTPANADPSTYSDAYKKWLLDFAEAQMYSFEFGWGWFYWTWKTETAVQWSYQSALAAGIMPKNARTRSFNCEMSIPDYAGMGLPEYY